MHSEPHSILQVSVCTSGTSMADQAFSFWKGKDCGSQESAPAPARPAVPSKTPQRPSGRRVPPPLPGYRPSHVAGRGPSAGRRRSHLLDGPEDSAQVAASGGEGGSGPVDRSLTRGEKGHVAQLAERLNLILASPPPVTTPTKPER